MVKLDGTTARTHVWVRIMVIQVLLLWRYHFYHQPLMKGTRKPRRRYRLINESLGWAIQETDPHLRIEVEITAHRLPIQRMASGAPALAMERIVLAAIALILVYTDTKALRSDGEVRAQSCPLAS
jgi:hypothetical protein